MFLVLLNAFFVASEFSMVKIRNTRIQAIRSNYGLRGRLLAQINKQLDTYLSVCQLGITLASLGLGWIGEPAFAYLFGPLFHLLGLQSPKIIEISSFLLAFGLISFLHIVVGELMPKSLAIRQAETIAIWTSIPLYVFYWLMYPAIWLLNFCSNFLLSAFKLNSPNNQEGIYSNEELKLILNSTYVHGVGGHEERNILQHALDFAELTVTDIMRPASDMILLDVAESPQALYQKIIDSRYSRYPIYNSETKEIIGIIHVKDLFADFLRQNSINNLSEYVRPILKVNDKFSALHLLRKFREGSPHFAVIYNSKDTNIGFVTLDNLLRVLIGKIKDEFHRTHENWVKHPDGTITTTGDCSLYSLEQALNCSITLRRDEESLSTLYGLIIYRCGNVPNVGDVISFKEFDALIEEVEKPYLEKIKIIPKK